MAKKGSGTTIIILVVLASLALADRSEDGSPPGTTGADRGGLDLFGDVCDETQALESPEGSFVVPTDDADGGTGARDCEMESGEGGVPVRALQNALATCYGQQIEVDGEFGDATEDAVEAAQSLHGLPVDGAYGPATGDVLLWPTVSADGATSCVTHPG
ncbi:MAG TPA: peptidoglycan-binding domain-containing protein [Acidimicrobiales bacterium]|nr:peptidoglycan-binding domain-containing protein [Acidimicrobiales bacterium]